jgi:poly(A) polymerase
LLPADAALADAIGARLKLSNRARKRIAAAIAEPAAPRVLAYRLGTEGAVDALLLSGKPMDAAAIAEWPRPRLPIGGGALIARGITEGPLVARTLRAIETEWIEAGFPQGDAFERIVADVLARTAR